MQDMQEMQTPIFHSYFKCNLLIPTCEMWEMNDELKKPILLFVID